MTDLNCPECDGLGFCEYGRGEYVKEEACEICNLGGNEPNEDEEYERYRDSEIDREEAMQEARD